MYENITLFSIFTFSLIHVVLLIYCTAFFFAANTAKKVWITFIANSCQLFSDPVKAVFFRPTLLVVVGVFLEEIQEVQVSSWYFYTKISWISLSLQNISSLNKDCENLSNKHGSTVLHFLSSSVPLIKTLIIRHSNSFGRPRDEFAISPGWGFGCVMGKMRVLQILYGVEVGST